MDRLPGKATTWGILLLGVLVAGNGVLSYRNLQRLATETDRKERAHEALFELQELGELSQDALAAATEYALSPAQSPPQAERHAAEEALRQLGRLDQVVDQLPDQSERLVLFKQQVERVVALGDDLVGIRQRQGPAAAAEFVDHRTGKAALAALRRNLGDIRSSQQAVFERWADESHDRQRSALINIVNATMGAVLLVGAVYGLMRRDRFQRNRTERLLRAGEARFRRLVDANVMGVFFMRFDGRVTDANDALLGMIGYSRADLTAGRIDWRRITPPEFAAADDQAIKQLRRSGASTPIEKEFIRQDGSRVACLVAAALLEESDELCICYAIDLTDRKKSEETIRRLNGELQDRLHELETLFELLPVGLGLAKDAECHEVAINTEFARLLGLPRREETNLTATWSQRPAPFKVLKDGREVPEDELPIRQVARTGRPVLDAEFEVIRADGSSVKLLEYVAPLFDGEGRSRGCVGAFVDVTERKRLEDQLTRSNQAKDALLAMLGHELRNPLAAVSGAAELIAAHRPDERVYQQSLAILRRQIGHLTQLIDDMLDLARLTAGKIRLRMGNVNLVEALSDCAQISQSVIVARRHQLTFDMPGQPVIVRGDRVRLEQIFSNLLTNAAKYTDPGGKIDIRVATEDGKATVRVRDNGIGLAPEMIPTLFELFAQVNPHLDRTEAGLGIGLTVVRNLVELHGGKISAFSRGLGQGSEFVVELPLASGVAAAASEPPSPLQQSDTPHRKLQVLVVEDQPDIARVMQALIERCGHQPQWASSAPDALQLARAERPDVAFIDIGLPGMNGYELASCMRADPLLKDLSLIALTGYGQEEDRARCYRSGFKRHLVKPIHAQTLATILRQCSEGSLPIDPAAQRERPDPEASGISPA